MTELLHHLPIIPEYSKWVRCTVDGCMVTMTVNTLHIHWTILLHMPRKKAGYYEIVEDANNLVMPGSSLVLYPPTPSESWTKSGMNQVIVKLNELHAYRFKLTNALIGYALIFLKTN